MLLQRCIDKSPLIAMLLGMLLLAGCAGSGAVKGSSGSQQSTGPDAAETGGEPARAVPSAARSLFEQAAASMAGGDFVDAELRFKEFLLQYPEFPGAHVNLAIIHVSNSNEAAARASIDAALALDPNHPAALNQSGMLLRRNGKFLEAEAAYMKAVTVSPDYALAHYNLGVLNELYLQRLDVALRNFEAYQRIVGEDKQVAKWIRDLTRRVATNQRTANVVD
jgi:tetratricopeptide (TPR) repeat protein